MCLFWLSIYRWKHTIGPAQMVATAHLGHTDVCHVVREI